MAPNTSSYAKNPIGYQMGLQTTLLPLRRSGF
jgi:hypothetical protein